MDNLVTIMNQVKDGNMREAFIEGHLVYCGNYGHILKPKKSMYKDEKSYNLAKIGYLLYKGRRIIPSVVNRRRKVKV